jgi:hypothetical protein
MNKLTLTHPITFWENFSQYFRRIPKSWEKKILPTKAFINQ